MAKVTKVDRKPNERRVITAKTQKAAKPTPGSYKWWVADNKKELVEQILSTANFLKQNQLYRNRQAALFSKLYGNQPMYNFAGGHVSKMSGAAGANLGLPIDRPTMNVVQSCIDTLVSRITQSRPRPIFLTDNGDYKERKLAKQMNNFINGELYQTHAHDLAALILRDAAIFGTGVIKMYENDDHRICLERRLPIELFVDPNDSMYGDPRQLFEVKLVDRSVLKELYPDNKKEINAAEQAFPDQMADATRTVSDQVIICEAWHLPSGKEAEDGRHVIVCSSGVILDEPWEKETFPFVFMHYSPRPLGFWAQGLAEQLMGTQTQINELLITISRSINLLGVPRVFIETGSKVSKASFNNSIGALVEYTGTRPEFVTAPCIAQEVYAQLERLIQFAYQQSGISALAATSQKPAGLNSGEAIRNYDDLQSDRFASLQKRYDQMFIDLAYLICHKAHDIVEEQGSYETVYPNKNGTKEIELKEVGHLDDPFVIQCFDSSSLPRDPAGRLQKITEMMQAGLISPDEGRRLLDYPDIEQVDKLMSASEERILQVLDDIVEEGKYTPPDPFMNLQLAQQLCVQYYNLYVPAKLEEKRAEMLRQFFTQIQTIMQAAQPPPPIAGAPQAAPMPPPQSEMIPNVPMQ